LVWILEIIQKFREVKLFDENRLARLPITDDYIEAEFKGQICCSSNALTEAGLLYLFVHDSSEVRLVMSF